MIVKFILMILLISISVYADDSKDYVDEYIDDYTIDDFNIRKLKIGIPCSFHWQCHSGYCTDDGLCAIPNNIVCFDNNECASGYCDPFSNRCHDGSSGNGCLWGDNCQSGYCLGYECVNKEPTDYNKCYFDVACNCRVCVVNTCEE